MPFGKTNASSPLIERKIAQKNKTADNAQAMLDFATSRYQEGWKDLWANPLGLNPQEVCDAWGTNAATYIMGAGMFMDAATAGWKAQGLTDQQIAQKLKQPLQNITINKDGTVTIG